jgi:transposase
MSAALPIRGDLTPKALRRRARHEANRRAALRMLAIANASEGMSRAEAARLAGPRTAAAARCCADGASALPMLERQALRDAVVRYNAEGPSGLYDRPKAGRPPRPGEAEQAALAARVFRGPDPARDGVAAWTRADLCFRLEERFGQPFHPSSLSRGLKRLDRSRQKTRPVHPEADVAAQARFRKGAARQPEGSRCGPSRQTDRALVHGRLGAARPRGGSKGPALPPLVAPGPPATGALR